MPARASFPPPMPMLDSTQVYGADGRIVRALPSPGASRRKETERDPRRNRRGKKKTSRGLDSVRENDRVPAASSAASARLRSEKRQSPAASARLCSGERQSPGRVVGGGGLGSTPFGKTTESRGLSSTLFGRTTESRPGRVVGGLGSTPFGTLSFSRPTRLGLGLGSKRKPSARREPGTNRRSGG